MPVSDEGVEAGVMRKVVWRLLPFLFACHLVSFLDRVNVGFAVLAMNRDLGLSSADFGLGAGLFFLSYFLLEVPANLALQRFGARRWFARIMISWGLVSAAFAFIEPIAAALHTSDRTVFYALRFLLGAAEAGFFPGVIYYLTLWFPAAYQARAVAVFMLAVPAAMILGAPLSGVLLTLDGGGLRGWQWLFVVEAIPSVILGLATLRLLRDGPARATGWLSPAERGWLSARLTEERQAQPARACDGLIAAMRGAGIWAFCVIYFVLAASLYTFSFFLPTIVEGFGVGDIQLGLLAALPSLCGAISMVLLGRGSDRTGWRRAHLSFAYFVAAAGMAGAGLLTTPAAVLAALCLVGIGLLSIPPLFWPLPSASLPARQAPAVIAAINAFGNLGGFLGPSAFGLIRDATGGFAASFVGLGIVLVAAAVLSLLAPGSGERPAPGG